jgi:transposase-like protein
MSKAQLVITAVVVEGRSKSEVARDYNISRYWVQQLCRRYQTEGGAAFEPRSRRPHASQHAVSAETEERIVRLRKTLSRKGLTPALTPSPLIWPMIPTSQKSLRYQRSGGSWPAAASSYLNRRNAPALRGNASAPNNPTSAGKPTSPTGASPTEPRWRSSTSSTTTPGY